MDDVIKFGAVVAMMLAVASFAAFMVPIAIRNFRRASRADDAPGEIDALRSEVDELRSLAPRMAELEERLDFAERLLSATRPNELLRDGSLPRGRDD